MGFLYKSAVAIAIISALAVIVPYVYQQMDQREFNRRTTAEEAAKGNQFNDKVVIVTGASSGIGISTTKVLYENGAAVVMGCRNLKKGNKVRNDILSQTKGNKKLKESNLNLIQLDLGSLKSVDSFIKEFKSKYDKINIIINNAGVMGFDEFGVTKDTKIERQYGINVLGHYRLTQQLTPLLIKSSNNGNGADGISRVINVASAAYAIAPMDIKSWLINDDKLKNKDEYGPMIQYGLTKACNILYSYIYNKRYSSKGVYSISLHPGAIKTGLQDSNFWLGLWNKYTPNIYTKSPSQGAATSIRLAAMNDTEFIENGGKYFEDCNIGPLYRSELFNDELGELLMSLNDKLIRQYSK